MWQHEEPYYDDTKPPWMITAAYDPHMQQLAAQQLLSSLTPAERQQYALLPPAAQRSYMQQLYAYSSSQQVQQQGHAYEQQAYGQQALPSAARQQCAQSSLRAATQLKSQTQLAGQRMASVLEAQPQQRQGSAAEDPDWQEEEEEEEPLLRAARCGDLEALRVALEAGACAYTEGSEGETAAHLAAAGGHRACLAALLEAAGDLVDAEDEYQETPLHAAAAAGHVHCVNVLLQAGADSSAINGFGGAPLHAAAANGHIGCVQTLLEDAGGPGAMQPCGAGETAAHWAARGGHVSVLRALLKAGADVEAEDSKGQRPLHWAAAGGSLPAIRCLVFARGADAAARDAYGCTPCQVAAAEGHLGAAQMLAKFEQESVASGTHLCHWRERRKQQLRQQAASKAAARAAAASEWQAHQEGQMPHRAVGMVRNVKAGAKQKQQTQQKQQHMRPLPVWQQGSLEEGQLAGSIFEAQRDGMSYTTSSRSSSSSGSMSDDSGGRDSPAPEERRDVPVPLLLATAKPLPLLADLYGSGGSSSGTSGSGSGISSGRSSSDGSGSSRSSSELAAGEMEQMLQQLCLGLPSPPRDPSARSLWAPRPAPPSPGGKGAAAGGLAAEPAADWPPDSFFPLVFATSPSTDRSAGSAARRDGDSSCAASLAYHAGSSSGSGSSTCCSGGSEGEEEEEMEGGFGGDVFCPITHEPMQDPVQAADGHTYERVAIEAWIARHEAAGEVPCSPLTNLPLSHLELQPNQAVRSLVASLNAAGLLSSLDC